MKKNLKRKMMAVYIRIYTYLQPPTGNIKSSHLECLEGTEKMKPSRLGKMALWLTEEPRFRSGHQKKGKYREAFNNGRIQMASTRIHLQKERPSPWLENTERSGTWQVRAFVSAGLKKKSGEFTEWVLAVLGRHSTACKGGGILEG